MSEETVISTEELHQLAAIVEAAREFLLPIEHDGPCVNYDDQNPDDYDPYDSCSRHLRAAAERKERLAEALRQYDGEATGQFHCIQCGEWWDDGDEPTCQCEDGGRWEYDL